MADHRQQSSIWNTFLRKLGCDCFCGDRDTAPEATMQTSTVMERRSTATTDRGKEEAPIQDIVDKSYMANLLQGLKDSYSEHPSQVDVNHIQKKKRMVNNTPRWNGVLNQMLVQAVNLYGHSLDLIHAFFPGFEREFIERKVKKAAKTLNRKVAWTEEEDKKLLRFASDESTELSSVIIHFPGKSLSAIIQRASFLTKVYLHGHQLDGHGENIGNEVGHAEDEYDFNKVITGTNCEEFSISTDYPDPGYDSEAIDHDYSFNALEAGFCFTFEPDVNQNFEIDPSPRNLNAHKASTETVQLQRRYQLEFDRDASIPETMENPINYLFPQARKSFAELLEQRATSEDKSPVESFLDFNKESMREGLDSGQNSPTLANRAAKLKTASHGSIDDIFK